MSELVIVEDRGAVRNLTLNRPDKRNALNEELVLAIGDALSAAADDDSVHCVVLGGNGPMFSSGMDLGLLKGLSEQPELLRPFRRIALDIYNLPEEMNKPTVCKIQGACIGGAMELALACDLRVMAEDALIGIPEARVGLIPDLGGCSRLSAVVGVGRAKELIMTGRMVAAQEAREMGLVNRVASEEDLDTVTDALVGELLNCAPRAIGLAKRVLDSAAKPALAATLDAEITAQQVLVTSDDFKEGAAAFYEKRMPVFDGR